MGGYTQINDTTWKKNTATPYIEVTANGETYYLPTSGVTFYNGTDPVPASGNKIAIKNQCSQIKSGIMK